MEKCLTCGVNAIMHKLHATGGQIVGQNCSYLLNVRACNVSAIKPKPATCLCHRKPVLALNLRHIHTTITLSYMQAVCLHTKHRSEGFSFSGSEELPRKKSRVWL